MIGSRPKDRKITHSTDQVMKYARVAVQGQRKWQTSSCEKRIRSHDFQQIESTIPWPWAVIEGSLAAKLPTISTDGKAEVGRVSEEKGRKKIRQEKESEQRKVEKVAKHYVFPNVLWLWRVEK